MEGCGAGEDCSSHGSSCSDGNCSRNVVDSYDRMCDGVTGLGWPTRYRVSIPLYWTYKSIFLVLAVPLLVSPALLQVVLAPVAFVLEETLLIGVADLVFTFVFTLA